MVKSFQQTEVLGKKDVFVVGGVVVLCCCFLLLSVCCYLDVCFLMGGGGGVCVYRSQCKTDRAPTVNVMIDVMNQIRALAKPCTFCH